MYDRLEKLIGRHFVFQGQRWMLIEVMPENDSLVLRASDDEKTLQFNQYGSATRYSTPTLTVSISDEANPGNYSEALTQLLSGIEKNG